jgi:hypothetical protein
MSFDKMLRVFVLLFTVEFVLRTFFGQNYSSGWNQQINVRTSFRVLLSLTRDEKAPDDFPDESHLGPVETKMSSRTLVLNFSSGAVIWVKKLIFGPRWCLHLGPNPFIWGQM